MLGWWDDMGNIGLVGMMWEMLGWWDCVGNVELVG